jgi:hypothetical protein
VVEMGRHYGLKQLVGRAQLMLLVHFWSVAVCDGCTLMDGMDVHRIMSEVT